MTTHNTPHGIIVTEYWAKPIPQRNFDWCAVLDGFDGAEDANDPSGWGATEEAAIQGLIDAIEEREA